MSIYINLLFTHLGPPLFVWRYFIDFIMKLLFIIGAVHVNKGCTTVLRETWQHIQDGQDYDCHRRQHGYICWFSRLGCYRTYIVLDVHFSHALHAGIESTTKFWLLPYIIGTNIDIIVIYTLCSLLLSFDAYIEKHACYHTYIRTNYTNLHLRKVMS